MARAVLDLTVATVDITLPTKEEEFRVLSLKVQHQFLSDFAAQRAHTYRASQEAAHRTIISTSATLNAIAHKVNPDKYARLDSELEAKIPEFPQLPGVPSWLTREMKKHGRAMLVATVAAAGATIFTCYLQGRTVRETCTLLSQNAGAAGIGAGLLSWITEWIGTHALNALGSESIANAILAIGINATEEGIRQWLMAGICPLLGVIMDIVNYWRRGGAFFSRRFIMFLCDSIFCKAAVTAAGVAVSAYSAVWTVIVVMAMTAVCGAISQRAADQETTVVGSLVKGLLGVPRALLGVAFPPGPNPNVPDELCCQITFTLLNDPVFFRGYVVSRQVAVNRLAHNGLDFYNLPAAPADIKPMPELKRLVCRYRTIFGA